MTLDAIVEKESNGFFNKFCKFIGKNKWVRSSIYTLSAFLALEGADILRNNKVFGQENYFFKQVTKNQYYDEFPRWSPDGKKIVFNSYRQDKYLIYTTNIDGTNEERVTDLYSYHPDLSPDGRKIVFESISNDKKYKKIIVINLDNKEVKDIVKMEISSLSGIYNPAWSYNGQYIIYEFSTTSSSWINRVDSIGSEPTTIIKLGNEESAISPSWSLDGNFIAFRYRNIGDNDNIAKFPVDKNGVPTGPMVQLTQDRYNYNPSWSPDGKKIAYHSGFFNDNTEIWLMDADGNNKTRITNNNVWDGNPSWSPDGKKIVFSSKRSDGFNNEIWVVYLEGEPPEFLSDTINVDIGYKAILTKYKQQNKLSLEVIVENNNPKGNNAPEGFEHLKEVSWYSDNLTKATNVEFFFKTEDGVMHSFDNQPQDLTLYENIKVIFPFLKEFIDKAENFHDNAYKFLDFLNNLRPEIVKPQKFTINKDKLQIYINNDLNRNDIQALSLFAPEIVKDSVVVTLSGDYNFKDFIKFSVGQKEYLFPSAKIEYGVEVVEDSSFITKQMRDHIYNRGAEMQPTLVDITLKNIQVKDLTTNSNPIEAEKTKITLEIENISNYDFNDDITAKIEPFDIKNVGEDQKLFNNDNYKYLTRLSSQPYYIFKKFHLSLNKKNNTTIAIEGIRFYNRPKPIDGISITLVSDKRVGMNKYFEQIDYNDLNNFNEITFSLQKNQKPLTDIFSVFGSFCKDTFNNVYNNFKSLLLFSEKKNISENAEKSIENIANNNFKQAGKDATIYLKNLTDSFVKVYGDDIQKYFLDILDESWREYTGTDLEKAVDFAAGIAENLTKDSIATVIAGSKSLGKGQATDFDLFVKDDKGNETHITSTDTINNIPISKAYSIAGNKVIQLKTKGNYTIEARAKTAGSIDMTVTQAVKDTFKTITYDVPIQQNNTAKLNIGINVKDDTLRIYDQNNNLKDVVTDIKDTKELLSLPKEYKLFQNYPNPFNPLTTIESFIIKISDVKLDVYNVRGQKIKSLVNERRSPGKYSDIWDGTNEFRQKVASGIYLYRLESDKFVETRKMIFLK